MRAWKVALLLAILFMAAFSWSGGAVTVLSDAKTHAVSALSARVWQKTIILVDLRRAVDAKLDRRHFVPLTDIPLTLQQAVIAVEDHRFYQHRGIDLEGLARAALVNLQEGSFQEGGSTITQQLVKNLFLSQDKTVSRKAEEMLLALDLELRYSKEDILAMYLNTAYFGAGAYGIGDAARTYFDKSPADLTLAEASLLAGLLQAPSALSPYSDYAAARDRQQVVLAVMAREGYITPSMAEAAYGAPLHLAPPR